MSAGAIKGQTKVDEGLDSHIGDWSGGWRRRRRRCFGSSSWFCPGWCRLGGIVFPSRTSGSPFPCRSLLRESPCQHVPAHTQSDLGSASKTIQDSKNAFSH